jgi:hypothetical protein
MTVLENEMQGWPFRVIAMLFLAGFATGCVGFPGVEPYVIITDEPVYIQNNINVRTIFPNSAAISLRRGEEVTITGIYNYRGNHWYHVLLRTGRTGFIDGTEAVLGTVKNVPIIEAPLPVGVNIWVTDLAFETLDGRSSCETLTPVAITVQNTDADASQEIALRVQFFDQAMGIPLEEVIYRIPALEPMQTYKAVVSLNMHSWSNGGYRVRTNADYDNKIHEVDEWDNYLEVQFSSACGHHP